MGSVKNQTRALIEGWREGVLTAQDVHEAAEDLVAELAFEGAFESETSDAISSNLKEVLLKLDTLDYQLVTTDDIPELLRFLEAPSDPESDEWERWREYWAGIDYVKRKRKLKSDPYYWT